ncbi:MAG TPA: DUF2007 domain-containing protein [Bacteroidales bacterium]|nr:DUF2007 domain-containing protein [Bacteroidales bacterium]HQL69598.1 DUF2007 domain-containing protein [Bacteroidales bacterium]
MSDWKKVYTTGVDYLAELLKQVLTDNGIEAVVMNKKDVTYLFGAVEVMVKTEDFEAAKQITEEFEKNTRIE